MTGYKVLTLSTVLKVVFKKKTKKTNISARNQIATFMILKLVSGFLKKSISTYLYYTVP